MLNIGNDGVEACRALAASDHFAKLRAALIEASRRTMNSALEAAVADRMADNVGYARALRDVCLALESAATGKPINQVMKHGLIREGTNAAR